MNWKVGQIYPFSSYPVERLPIGFYNDASQQESLRQISMKDLEERLNYLEANNDVLNMQNRVLAVVIKAILRALPTDIAQDTIESIQAAFEDEIAELSYLNSHHSDIFQDIAYEFFRDKN